MNRLTLPRRFLADYTRNPANLLLLVLVPIVFVVAAAGTLADAARLLGGAGGGTRITTVTAGWTAGFLAAVGMFFQISSARDMDRRLALAGMSRPRLVVARLAAGGVVALIASGAALAALAFRAGIDDLSRVALGTLMSAVIHLALGAIVGATVRTAVNGLVVIMFIWIIDVFFGPTMTESNAPVTRALPTHFVSLWTLDVSPAHGGPSALTWSLLWTMASLVAAFGIVRSRTTTAKRTRTSPSRHNPSAQLAMGLRMGLREWRRTPVLWVLLAAVPAVFIWLSDLITPHGSTPITLRENGRAFIALVDPANMHAGTMAPLAVGSLAALAGIFIVLDTSAADQRLAVAGQPPLVLLATRLGLTMAAVAVGIVASLGITAAVFTPHQWFVYAAANILAGMTYGLIGVVLGPVFGRVSGAFLAFLIPFVDLGIGQSPMLQGEPAPWARWLPGYGSIRILIDGALTSTFDELPSLLPAGAWLAALTGLATWQVYRTTHVVRSTAASAATGAQPSWKGPSKAGLVR